MAARLAARIKILSKLDIAERRVPQDGRMQMRLSKTRSIDFRVSTCPTMYGEKVVIRVLDPSATTVGVENLGFEPEQRDLYMDAIARPDGMILVTGPTGSGKTVTLYTALRMLNSEQKNVSTVEDPVEINLTGVNQVQINEKAGLLFSTALRSFLRQDPDIIMVGEIRDLETAEIAVKASQTGHLVLSTLHTNDAPSTLTRLINMGVPAFNIASSVHLIIAQRLARRLCVSCKAKKEYPESVLTTAGFLPDELDELEIYEPVGCDNCTNGYKGRVGIFQLLPLSSTMAELIMKGTTEADITRLADEEGHINLRQAGLNKIRQGLTSLEEIERVTNN
jgi:type IV pilus assembly protein PilB